jgi:hemolysin activation/secretion protein
MLLLSLSLSLSTAIVCTQAAPALAKEASAVKTIDVTDISYAGNTKLSAKQITFLLPELKKGNVDIDVLSRQIQIANDSGAVNLAVNFSMLKTGKSIALVTVKELPAAHTFLSTDNTGNEQTGDYRTTLTYINTNTSKHADTFAASFVTSPNHTQDVKQAALFYRMLLPKASDSLYVTYTYSDVDMGRIAQVGSFGIDALGKGHSYGLHYQKNLVYLPAHRSSLDFGADYNNYDNSNPLSLDGTNIANIGTGKVDTAILSLSYNDSTRSKNDVFSYTLGYSSNVGGDTADYDRQAADKNFGIFKYGLNYQHKYAGDWLTNFKINGQYTSNTLISQAKLGGGGMYTVRGFAEQVLQAEKGAVGSVELYSPEIAKGQRMVAFADYAHLSASSESIGFKDADLGSVGLGWRYNNADGWSGRVDYGFVVEGKKYNTHEDSGRLHLSVTKKL